MDSSRCDECSFAPKASWACLHVRHHHVREEAAALSATSSSAVILAAAAVAAAAAAAAVAVVSMAALIQGPTSWGWAVCLAPLSF